MREKIRQLLKLRRLSQRRFCKNNNISVSEFNEFLNGKRQMTKKMAFALEEQFTKSAEYWLCYQVKEDIALIRAGLTNI